MRRTTGLAIALATLARFAAADEPVRVYAVTHSQGFIHDVVRPRNGGCDMVDILREMSRTGAFVVEASADIATLTKERLGATDVVVFYTSGDLPFGAEAFAALDGWIKRGGGVLAIHSAVDSLTSLPGWRDLLGARLDGHPWDAETTVAIRVWDRAHPAVAHWEEVFEITEEIYHYGYFDPRGARILAALDMERTALKFPECIPVAWCKDIEKGRLLFTVLGHGARTWHTQSFRTHLAGAIAWLARRAQGDATPDLTRWESELGRARTACLAIATSPPTRRARDPWVRRAARPGIPRALEVSLTEAVTLVYDTKRCAFAYATTAEAKAPDRIGPLGIRLVPDRAESDVELAWVGHQVQGDDFVRLFYAQKRTGGGPAVEVAETPWYVPGVASDDTRTPAVPPRLERRFVVKGLARRGRLVVDLPPGAHRCEGRSLLERDRRGRWSLAIVGDGEAVLYTDLPGR